MRSISIESSTPFTPRSSVEQGWGCRYADPSSMLTAASCGRRRTSLGAPYFSSPCRRTTTHKLSSIGVPGCRAERRHRSRSRALNPSVKLQQASHMIWWRWLMISPTWVLYGLTCITRGRCGSLRPTPWRTSTAYLLPVSRRTRTIPSTQRTVSRLHEDSS